LTWRTFLARVSRASPFPTAPDERCGAFATAPGSEGLGGVLLHVGENQSLELAGFQALVVGCRYGVLGGFAVLFGRGAWRGCGGGEVQRSGRRRAPSRPPRWRRTSPVCSSRARVLLAVERPRPPVAARSAAVASALQAQDQALARELAADTPTTPDTAALTQSPTSSPTSSPTATPTRPRRCCASSSPTCASTAAAKSCPPTGSARPWFAHRQVQWS
jgi:hypothetical protein